MNEIAYQINPEATLQQQCLVLEPLEGKKEGFSFQLLSSPVPHLVSYWRGLVRQAADQDLFKFLLKEELAFQQKALGKTPSLETWLLKQFRVSPVQTMAAFQLLAASKKLFCQGKNLIIDLFGRAEFYYEARALAQNQLEVIGKIRWRETDVLLSECEAIGPGKPPWFVRGIQLKMIGTSISWKALQSCRSFPLILEGVEKQCFLDDLDPQDPETAQLVLKKGESPPFMLPLSPYPRLLLADRWGAFANLEMEYGQAQRIAFHDSDRCVRDSQGKELLKRQLEEEGKWEKDLLETDFIKKRVDSTHYYCPMDRVAKSLTFLLEIGWQIQDWQGRRLLKETGCTLELEEHPHSLLLKGVLHYQDYQADLQSVKGAFNRREQFIQLSAETVGLLPSEGPYEILKDLAEESEWVQEGVVLKKFQFGTLGALWEEIVPSPSLSELKNKWQHFKGIQEALPSSSFQGTLRPYQQEGVNWLSFLYAYGFHGLLADEMGLGKTIQVLAFLSRVPAQKGPHLIIMPTSLLFNWRQEISQFLPSLPFIVHHGQQRSGTAASLQETALILTSYTTLRLDLPLFQSLTYSCLILDEAQIIKNAHTQIAHCVCQLQAQMKISLTGTPIENHLQELWSHFRFLIPDLLGSRESFEANLQAAQADRRYLERMKRKIFPFILRRRKQEVAKDLPQRLDQTVWIEMEEEQRALYEQLLARFKKGVLKKVGLEGIKSHRLDVLEAILRLRQVCCHPLLVSSLGEKPVEKSAKFEALFQDLETVLENGRKVLVYSQFTSMLKWMTQEANQRKWSYSYLDGATTNREEMVTQFQQDPHRQLFFISLKAGGVGLNLTAADHVYLYDPWWNEAVEEQAIQRAHRIGREKIVIAKRFVIRESIEEKMMRLKETKRVAIEDLFESDRVPDALTLEDLEFLLT